MLLAVNMILTVPQPEPSGDYQQWRKKVHYPASDVKDFLTETTIFRPII